MNKKAQDTILKKYGSWEAYKLQRYHTPEAKANQLKAAKAGGKASTSRPFRDIPDLASKAGKMKYGKGKYGE